MSFLRPLESFIGMFQCLPGVLVSGLVIFFPVVRGGGAVCVCGVFVEFGSSLVRFIWHSFSHPRWPFSRNLQQFRFPSCSVVGIRCARTSGETLSPLRCTRSLQPSASRKSRPRSGFICGCDSYRTDFKFPVWQPCYHKHESKEKLAFLCVFSV
jgi:hypothetical protein